jgi:hypothetical protein
MPLTGLIVAPDWAVAGPGQDADGQQCESTARKKVVRIRVSPARPGGRPMRPRHACLRPNRDRRAGWPVLTNEDSRLTNGIRSLRQACAAASCPAAPSGDRVGGVEITQIRLERTLVVTRTRPWSGPCLVRASPRGSRGALLGLLDAVGETPLK